MAFVDALLPGDRIRVGAFADGVTMSPRWTGDRAEALDQLKVLRPRGEMTAVDDAIQTGSGALDGQQERQVLLILSDGAFVSVPTRASLVPERVTVFFVGVARKANEPLGPYLKSAFLFADAAGGGHRLLRPGDDLVLMFKRISEELHHRYLLGFPPLSLDGKEHRIQVRLTKPGLTALAGAHYLAGDR